MNVKKKKKKKKKNNFFFKTKRFQIFCKNVL